MLCNKEKDKLFQDYIEIQDLPWNDGRELYSWQSKAASPIQFGYEAEFQPHEIRPLFAFYQPVETWIPLAHWQLLPDEDKISRTRDILGQLEHGNLSVLFVRKSDAPDSLPQYLYRDDTKNLELRFGPTSTLAEFQKQARLIEENLGIGSLQAVLSLSQKDFFADDDSVQKHLGWFGFFNEMDILERLVRGYLWSESYPQSQVMKTFAHPFLGPMIEVRHRLLRKFLRENAKGEMLDEESLIRPRRREHSFKFVGSTAYRPDIAAPHRICVEIRDAHKDPELLRQRVARIIYYWQRDLSAFRRFSEVPAFDSDQSFASLPSSVQDWLKITIPFQGASHILNYDKPRFCYETFRNFSYPLRDWTAWLKALEASSLQIETVDQAQKNYSNRLKNLLCLSGLEAKIELQKSLARFSMESGLFVLFREVEKRLVRSLL
jgi:hypothetical protein